MADGTTPKLLPAPDNPHNRTKWILAGSLVRFPRSGLEQIPTMDKRQLAATHADTLGDRNLDLLHDLPVGIDLLHYHEIAGSAQPATRIRDVESRLISIRIEAHS